MKNIAILFILVLISLSCLADVFDATPEALIKFAHTYHVPPILFAMLLTAIIETFVLWCLKYRTWKVLICFFMLNLISNFLVNAIYGYSGDVRMMPSLELGAVIFEASLLGLVANYSVKLWLSVICTNLVSFLVGILLFGT